MGACGGKLQSDNSYQQIEPNTEKKKPSLNTTTKGEPQSITTKGSLVKHIGDNISDHEKQRLYLQQAWNKYYVQLVNNYNKRRSKFACLQTLCHGLKFQKVDNIEKRIYGKNKEDCESIDILFNVNFNLKYNKQSLYFSASIQFNNKLSILKKNPFNKTNEYWKQNIIFLNDGKDNIFIMKDNGKLIENTCSSIQKLFDIQIDDKYLIFEFFVLFWNWFISKEILEYKQQNIVSYRIDHNNNNNNNNNDNNDDIEDMYKEYPESKTKNGSVVSSSSSATASSYHQKRRHGKSQSIGNILDTPGHINDEDLKNDDMDGPTKQFYIFLKNNSLEQYFSKFQDKNVANICYLIDLMDDKYLETDIGIDYIHRKAFIREAKEIVTQMEIFKQNISSLLFEKLSKNYGMITINMIIKEIENINQLKDKFNIKDDVQCKILWDVIEKQLYGQELQYKYSTEGLTTN